MSLQLKFDRKFPKFNTQKNIQMAKFKSVYSK